MELVKHKLLDVYDQCLNFQSQISLLNQNIYRIVTKRLLQFMIGQKRFFSKNPIPSSKDRNQSSTNFRLSRIIYVMNRIYHYQYVNLRILCKEIQEQLENDKQYKIDRKTMKNIVDDICEIGIATKKVFEITYQDIHIFNQKTFKSIFVVYRGVEVPDEVLKNLVEEDFKFRNEQ